MSPAKKLFRSLLALVPMAIVCVVGAIADAVSRAASKLDQACWRGVQAIEVWAGHREERSDG